MAMMLIIKLIKIKVMFLLPLLIGAGAAKKILLKVLLFVFPPLAHLFKLCSYYHHHASKFYHFHHHKVNVAAALRRFSFTNSGGRSTQ